MKLPILTILFLAVWSVAQAAFPTSGNVARYEPADIQPTTGTASVTGWNDSSGNGNHMVTVTGTAPDVETVQGFRMARWTANGYLSLPASLSSNARSLSIYMVIRTVASTNSYFMVSPGDGTVASLGVSTSNIQVNDGATKSSPFVRGMNRYLIGFRANATNTKAIANGEGSTLTVCGVATQTGGYVGVYPPTTGYFKGDMHAVFIWDHDLSDQELADLRDYCETTYYTGGTDLVTHYQMDGDSFTDGYGLDSRLEGWQYRFEQLLIGAKHRNNATSGDKVSEMVTQLNPQMYPGPITGNPLFATHTAVLQGGHNDLNTGDSAVTLEGNVTTWFNSCFANGYTKGIAFTIIKSAALVGSEETERVAYNTWLRANYQTAFTYPVFLADPDATGSFDDTSDTDVFQADGTHLNANGMQIYGQSAYDAIQSPSAGATFTTMNIDTLIINP